MTCSKALVTCHLSATSTASESQSVIESAHAGVERLCSDLRIDPSSRKVICNAPRCVMHLYFGRYRSSACKMCSDTTLTCPDCCIGPIQVLLLAWKMGASRMGYFSRQEFTNGIKLLNATSLDKLRKVWHSRSCPHMELSIATLHML